MKEIIAVETLTLVEISEMFRKSVHTVLSKAMTTIETKSKKLDKEQITKHKWVKTYEVFKGANLNFYCQKTAKNIMPTISIGMTHRTTEGMILVILDVANGGSNNGFFRKDRWEQWVKIYKGHACERFAERIVNSKTPTFAKGVEELMFSDIPAVARVIDNIAENVDKIELLFKDGCWFGYRDSANKIVYIRTTYSNDMLKSDRAKFRDDWELTLVEVHELFKKE